MAQTALAPNPPTWGNYLSNEWPILQLGLRIRYNIANREAWRILKDQDKVVKSAVLKTLHRYSTTWTPEDALEERADDTDDTDEADVEDGEFEELELHVGKMIELYAAAEMDFEQGLRLIREVEKGCSLKPEVISNWRPAALKSLCEVVQIAIEKLDPEPEAEEEEDSDDGDEDEDENDAADDDAVELSGDEAESTSGHPSHRLVKAEKDWNADEEKTPQAEEDTRDQHQKLELIGKVYETCMESFKARLQSLVNRYRPKEKKTTKR